MNTHTKLRNILYFYQQTKEISENQTETDWLIVLYIDPQPSRQSRYAPM